MLSTEVPRACTGPRWTELYLQTTHLEVDALKLEAEERSLSVGTAIEEHANRMSQILARQSDGDHCDALTYAPTLVAKMIMVDAVGTAETLL